MREFSCRSDSWECNGAWCVDPTSGLVHPVLLPQGTLLAGCQATLNLSVVQVSSLTGCHGRSGLAWAHPLKGNAVTMPVRVLSLQRDLDFVELIACGRQGGIGADPVEHSEALLLREWAISWVVFHYVLLCDTKKDRTTVRI
jgi:hypothetical protein